MSISVFDFFLFVVMLVVVGVIFLFFALFHSNPSKRNKFGLCGLSMIVLLAFSPLIYEFPFRYFYGGGNTFKVFVVKDNYVKYEKMGTWEWEHYVNIPNRIEVGSKIVLIDDSVDPHRLMTIKYEVIVSVDDAEKYLLNPIFSYGRQSLCELDDVRADMRKTVVGVLEDFNASCSFPASAFSRPSRIEEQVNFSDMLAKHVDPLLSGHGLVVKRVSFSIE